MVISFGLAACDTESQVDGDGPGESSLASETAGRETAERRVEREAGEVHAAEGERRDGQEGREGRDGEHGGEEVKGGHDEGGEGGEEPGVYIERRDTWDMTRGGARLVVAFNPARNAFLGRVENTTDRALCSVRVEVHLAGGPELGPTPRTDVPAGRTIDIELSNEGGAFETWTAHPELSACPRA